MVGTLGSAVGNLADVLNARTVMLLGCVAGAAANAALLIAPGAASVVGLRFATGMALALVYPPGMKIAAGWFRERRGLALGVLIGALTLGKAFPHLLTAIYGDRWREPVLMASMLAVLGGVLVFAVVRDGPFVAATAPFDPHAIRRIIGTRGARLATFGYLGHMWELYAMWTWIAVLATASFTASGVAAAGAAGSMAAFLAIGSGTTRLRSRRMARGSAGPRARGDLVDVDQRCLCRAHRRRLRARAGVVLPALDDLGLRRRRRLGAVLRHRQRIFAARASRHGADAADLLRFPADDGDDRDAAARGCDDRMAVGLAHPGPRPAAGHRRDAAASYFLIDPQVDIADP